jgi:hypothetical protein
VTGIPKSTAKMPTPAKLMGLVMLIRNQQEAALCVKEKLLASAGFARWTSVGFGFKSV